MIIQSGIKKVYVPKMKLGKHNQKWHDEKIRSEQMFEEADVLVEEYEDQP